MLKGIKIRIYPNKTQENYINRLLGCYRLVYNKCLAYKINSYKEHNVSLGLAQLGNYFHNELTKTKELAFLQEHNTKVLKQAIRNMLQAYSNFFQQNNHFGFPKFKSKKDNISSCIFPLEAISKRNNYLNGKLTLTKELRDLHFRCSDKYKNYLRKYKEGIRSATLSKNACGEYFLSILVDSDEVLTKSKTDKVIGIDLGIKDFIVTSDNAKFPNIKSIRNNEVKLKKLHKSLNRKKVGSSNRNKARIKLAKFYQKLSNIKQNYLHEVVNTLINENQVICIEDLNVSEMLKNHNLSKSIQELNLYEFRRILDYKCNWYGRYLITIDKYYPSSKLCSCCCYKNDDLVLSNREWICPKCGHRHNRDYNASLNILREGLHLYNEIIGSRTTEFTLVESSLLEHSLKQEESDLLNI
jgi:putative transposase